MEPWLGEEHIGEGAPPMGQPAATAPLKRRTREHVIAALSVNFVERFFLRKGHTVVKTDEDYGIDLIVSTYDQDGFVEPGSIYIQLKATDSPNLSADGSFYSFSISVRDYNGWAAQAMPVFLILYDAQGERAYWQYVQGYFESEPSRRPKEGARSVTVRIPAANRFDDAAVDYALGRKRDVMVQVSGVIKHVP
jgi:Domain of unknown function (DUF4365)